MERLSRQSKRVYLAQPVGVAAGAHAGPRPCTGAPLDDTAASTERISGSRAANQMSSSTVWPRREKRARASQATCGPNTSASLPRAHGIVAAGRRGLTEQAGELAGGEKPEPQKTHRVSQRPETGEEEVAYAPDLTAGDGDDDGGEIMED